MYDSAVCPARLPGEASVLLLGKPDEARGYYAQGLEICEKVRFRPEIELIRLDLAGQGRTFIDIPPTRFLRLTRKYPSPLAP